MVREKAFCNRLAPTWVSSVKSGLVRPSTFSNRAESIRAECDLAKCDLTLRPAAVDAWFGVAVRSRFRGRCC